jgi:HlyD family secretion protein
MRRKESQHSNKLVDNWLLILAIAMTLANGAFSLSQISNFQLTTENSVTSNPRKSPTLVAIGGLGRLEPQGEVIHLSAPTSVEMARVTKLLVQEGDKVRVGQAIAMLDSYESRLAALSEAKQQVQLAQANLAKVEAGAKTGEIVAQQATISRLEAESRGEVAALRATVARLEAELNNVRAEDRRYRELYRAGAISASMFDSKRLPVKTMQQQLKEAKANLGRTRASFHEQIGQAKATLNALTEVRPVDVRVAQAEVDSAIAAQRRAEAELNLAYVRAPINSQVLKIHTRPGEVVSSNGIVELGRTDRMYAVAEIYETDIKKVRVGQRATITSPAFSGTVQGTVAQIGLRVSKQAILDVNPTADTDRKVVEVKIQIDDDIVDNQSIASLTNLQVQVAIHIQLPKPV